MAIVLSLVLGVVGALSLSLSLSRRGESPLETVEAKVDDASSPSTPWWLLPISGVTAVALWIGQQAGRLQAIPLDAVVNGLQQLPFVAGLIAFVSERWRVETKRWRSDTKRWRGDWLQQSDKWRMSFEDQSDKWRDQSDKWRAAFLVVAFTIIFVFGVWDRLERRQQPRAHAD
mmetsp:Transcript_24552/g.79369  ORF Transcript_24552/g.79369 Transcript_24552/m.79369 type:complete len:173 (+) Transcript_24552:768-1286(+)